MDLSIVNILERSQKNDTVYVFILFNAGLPNNDTFYSPSTIEVHQSQQVKWTNDGELIHTVSSGDPSKSKVDYLIPV